MTLLFDGYIAVDWSGRAKRKRGANSIWIAVGDDLKQVQFENPGTREEATNRIEELLNEATNERRRLLCGFDFAFGYPEGTAQVLTGVDNWEGVWTLIAELVADQPNNQNRLREAAAELNECFEGEGPFWGINLPAGAPHGLSRRLPLNRWGVNLPPYRRHVERVFPGQSVWQVTGPGAVGGQGLTGIARLEGLRHRDDVQVWPFETLGEGRCHVFCEIYPSLIDPVPGGAVLDQRQVHAVAVRLRELDQAGLLEGRLHAPEGMPAAVRNEEALFLDIT